MAHIHTAGTGGRMRSRIGSHDAIASHRRRTMMRSASRRAATAGCGRSAADGGGNAIEESPPELERARHGAPDVCPELRGGREADHDVVADGAVLAAGLLVERVAGCHAGTST